MNHREELLRLMSDYPNLPIVFMCPGEDLDYNYTMLTNFTVNRGHVYLVDDRYFDDRIDVEEYLGDKYDTREYEGLSDKEYEEYVKQQADLVENYEAIIITLYAV